MIIINFSGCTVYFHFDLENQKLVCNFDIFFNFRIYFFKLSLSMLDVLTLVHVKKDG